MKKLTTVDAVVLHCSASDKCDVEDLKKWHIDENGWDDIGYHYLIRKDGSAHKCRSLEYRGAHVKGDNWHTIGICLEGQGLTQFTDEQYGKLTKLIKELTGVYGTLPIKGHFQYNSNKTCPLAPNESFDELLAEIIAKMIDLA